MRPCIARRNVFEMCNAKILLVIYYFGRSPNLLSTGWQINEKRVLCLKELLVGIVCRVDIIKQDAPHFISI
jgi:hypothetical protein